MDETDELPQPIPKVGWPRVQFDGGVPTFEDKVAQRAMVMLLEPIYEQDFKTCSYGFRPGRCCHDALRELYKVITRQGQYWVLDVDIRKYFDSIPHPQLRAFLDQRVTDGVISTAWSAKLFREEPDAVILHVRVCGG